MGRPIGRFIGNTRIPVYRVFGGESQAFGYYWSLINPRLYGSSYRAFAGLPHVNTANFMLKGHVQIHNILKIRPAKPAFGNPGLLVPEVQILKENVTYGSLRILK